MSEKVSCAVDIVGEESEWNKGLNDIVIEIDGVDCPRAEWLDEIYSEIGWGSLGERDTGKKLRVERAKSEIQDFT